MYVYTHAQGACQQYAQCTRMIWPSSNSRVRSMLKRRLLLLQHAPSLSAASAFMCLAAFDSCGGEEWGREGQGEEAETLVSCCDTPTLSTTHPLSRNGVCICVSPCLISVGPLGRRSRGVVVKRGDTDCETHVESLAQAS